MALQDSILKPSVCRSLSVNNHRRKSHVNVLSRRVGKASEFPLCLVMIYIYCLQKTAELTFGHDSVEDGPELSHRDLHVLMREKICIFY